MKAQFKLLGVKMFNDSIDGTKLDFTKLIVEVPQKPVDSESQFNAGFATLDMPFGDHTNVAKFKLKDLQYPAMVELEVDITNKGMTASDMTVIRPQMQQPKAA